MPRLTDPDPALFPDDVREFLTSLPPDPMVRMLSHSAGTVQPFVQLAKAQFTALKLPARSRELVILTVAEYTESAFVAAQHNPISQAAGVSERTRQLIRARQLHSLELSPPDSALLRFTVATIQQPRVPDEIFAQARQFLSERELVEVLQVIGYYWSFGRIATVLDVEVTKVYGSEPILDILDP
jgi:alkylhydroperoxidase family enzyme